MTLPGLLACPRRAVLARSSAPGAALLLGGLRGLSGARPDGQTADKRSKRPDRRPGDQAPGCTARQQTARPASTTAAAMGGERSGSSGLPGRLASPGIPKCPSAPGRPWIRSSVFRDIDRRAQPAVRQRLVVESGRRVDVRQAVSDVADGDLVENHSEKDPDPDNRERHHLDLRQLGTAAVILEISPVVAGVGLAGTPVFASLPVWTYPAVMPFAAAAVPVLKPSTVKMFTGISLNAV